MMPHYTPLYTHYTRIIHALYTHYTHIMHALYAHYTHIIYALYTHYTRIIHTLYTHIHALYARAVITAGAHQRAAAGGHVLLPVQRPDQQRLPPRSRPALQHSAASTAPSSAPSTALCSLYSTIQRALYSTLQPLQHHPARPLQHSAASTASSSAPSTALCSLYHLGPAPRVEPACTARRRSAVH
jgi:hypothetical protein